MQGTEPPLLRQGELASLPPPWWQGYKQRVGTFPKAFRSVEHRQAFAGFELNRPQMLDDLFGPVPFLAACERPPSLRSNLPLTLDQICPGRTSS